MHSHRKKGKGLGGTRKGLAQYKQSSMASSPAPKMFWAGSFPQVRALLTVLLDKTLRAASQGVSLKGSVGRGNVWEVLQVGVLVIVALKRANLCWRE